MTDIKPLLAAYLNVTVEQIASCEYNVNDTSWIVQTVRPPATNTIYQHELMAFMWNHATDNALKVTGTNEPQL
jgi:hypothetical protein